MRTLANFLPLVLLFAVGCSHPQKLDDSSDDYFSKLEARWKAPVERSDTHVTEAQIAESCQRMNVRFTARTIALGFKKETGLDDAIFLKVRMPQGDVDSFVATSPLAMTPFGGLATLPGANTLAPWWWNFTRKRKVRYAQVSLPKAEALHMLIEPEDDSSAVIYLVWHQT